ncbi:MAG: D-aminoacyl-tRNA deacylase [Fimbriimonadaceae bacterium]|nr:D-aminoacyl-tRNA deacylase [Fimbriimonadaceae bacterium]
MKAVVQRVLEAAVAVDGHELGRIGPGLAVLVAAHKEDTPDRVTKMAAKLVGLRIFNDAEGKMNVAVADALPESPSMLVISNFTVYGDTEAGRRPSFVASASYEDGRRHFDGLLEELRSRGIVVATGEFGADMKVSLVNDGPVTVIVET